jgi:hypothetical protein
MTPVTVGELNTDVDAVTAPALPSAGTDASHPWHDLDRLREAAVELARLDRRTRAEGFDDH